MEISIELVMFALFAALIAAIVRMYDTPVTKAAIKPFVIAYGSSLLAGVLTMWGLAGDSGVELSFVNFAIVAGAAVGGMSAVRAILEQFKGASKPAE